MKNTTFKECLQYGNEFEKEILNELKKLNVDCYNTNQEQDSDDRKKYHTVDLIIKKNDNSKTIGIECKIQNELYRKCLNEFGYDGKYNVVVNKHSLYEYVKNDFPVLILFKNELDGNIYGIQAKDLLLNYEPKIEFKNKALNTTDIKYNYDCRQFKKYNLNYLYKNIQKWVQ